MKRVLAASVGAALLIAAGLFACALLPERYAVNAPMLNMMSGWFGASAPSQDQFGARLRVPAGFSVGLFAEKLPSVRFLRPLPGGGLLATTPREGKVWLLTPDRDGDGRADAARPLIERLNRPHGMDLLGDWLYVAEGDGVGRVRIDPETGERRGDYERVVDGLPAEGNHWTRTVRFGPDGWMYVSVGSSCNVCVESDDRRAAMLRFRPDGREPQIFATGLRNSVGFDWQPGTNALYATDNGRDLLGDDFPPCELNLVELGGFYGWPVANGDRVPDPNLGAWPGGADPNIDSARPRLRRAHGPARHRLPAASPRFRKSGAAPRWWPCTVPGTGPGRADTRSSPCTGETMERSRNAISWSGSSRTRT